MTLPDLLVALSKGNASLREVNSRIAVRPAALLNDHLRKAIVEHREVLLSVLRAGVQPYRVAGHGIDPGASRPLSCWLCGHARWWHSADGDVDAAAPASPATGWTCGACHPPACPERVAWREEVAP